MKKRIILALAGLLLFTVIAYAQDDAGAATDEGGAPPTKLIDFSLLVPDYTVESNGDKHNKRTAMDFARVAGTRYTDGEKEEMISSLYLENWKVQLSSSSRTVENDHLTTIKAVTVEENATKNAGEQVMGIRIHYPSGSFNGYATITPPFKIPAYGTIDKELATKVGLEEDPGKSKQFEDGYGVLKNVGVLKRVEVELYGMNYPMALFVVLRDGNNVKHTYFVDYLDFEGWKTISWKNPNYIEDVKNREYVRQALYPTDNPSMIFEGFVVYRDAMVKGGDFVSYVKSVELKYDLASYGQDKDIDHEKQWKILEDREEMRRDFEYNRLGNTQVLRYNERKKMYVEDEVEADDEEATTE